MLEITQLRIDEMKAISSFQEFIDWTLETQSKSSLTLFRGQPVEGNLLPNIARGNPKYDSEQLEKTVLSKFKLMGTSLLRDFEKSTLDLMIVAQHFGLKTRLLDWTNNPLVALYFACSEQEEKDVYVYSLAAETMVAEDVFEKNPFALSRTTIFQPPMNNPRLIAQQGWFSIHRYVDSEKGVDRSAGLGSLIHPKDIGIDRSSGLGMLLPPIEKEGFVPLEKNKETKPYLDQIRVVSSAKKELLSVLAGHGIASHTMFPDLGGLTKYLNQTYSLGDSQEINS